VYSLPSLKKKLLKDISFQKRKRKTILNKYKNKYKFWNLLLIINLEKKKKKKKKIKKKKKKKKKIIIIIIINSNN